MDLQKCRLYNIQRLISTYVCTIPTFSRKDDVKICAIFGKSQNMAGSIACNNNSILLFRGAMHLFFTVACEFADLHCSQQHFSQQYDLESVLWWLHLAVAAPVLVVAIFVFGERFCGMRMCLDFELFRLSLRSAHSRWGCVGHASGRFQWARKQPHRFCAEQELHQFQTWQMSISNFGVEAATSVPRVASILGTAMATSILGAA